MHVRGGVPMRRAGAGGRSRSMPGAEWRAVALAAVMMSYVVAAGASGDDGFVRVMGTRFVDRHCQEFAFSGFNSWELMEAAAGIETALPVDQSHFEGQTLVQWAFETAAENQLLVGRFFGHGHAYGGLPLQTEPGVYNDQALRGLDSVIAEARNHGIKMILTLTDNWQAVDGKVAYAEWAGKRPDEFYTDDTIKQWFKNHINFMVDRVNSVSGVRYGDDDCIFAWNLINEARCDCNIAAPDESCDPQCTEDIQAWFEEMSDYLKSVDPVHMVSTGEEGFYALVSGRQSVNPDLFAGLPSNEYWASQSGQDFKRNHDMPGMDYAVIHNWPDNWAVTTVEFQDQWVREHMVDTADLGKPLVVEEFGKAVEEDDEEQRMNIRHPFFENMYDTFLSGMDNDSVLKGVGFWEFDANNAADPGKYGVHTTHSLWSDIIVPKTQELVDIVAALPLVENCAPGAIRSMTALVMDPPSDSYYISAGHNILDVSEGEEISSSSKVTAMECAELCDADTMCSSFAYNPEKDGGSCSLKGQVPKVAGSGGSSWNSDGWQTFHRKRGANSCSLDGCLFCTNDDTCLKCEKNNLLFRAPDGTLACQPCSTAQTALRQKRGECQGSDPRASAKAIVDATGADAIAVNAG